MKKYNPKTIEKKWQKIWREQEIYKADLQSQKPKYIAMSMFNYPSGAGIHIGHAMNYTISDVLARFKRQQGFESYHPVGWDSFGLPAENYAIKAGVSPQESMAKIIPNYHKQYQAMGWSNDWSKEIATHTPEYYKWTQWIFSEMFRAGLAYQDTRLQWWCDKCQTVLANEQVIDGKCWRHDSESDVEVVQREVKQWFFRITDYAEELLQATDSLDWTETVKTAQKNWIGKSVGAEIEFPISEQWKVNSGKKPNFVILHGFTASSKDNSWLKAELENRGYEVTVPDLPNTDKPTEEEQVKYVMEHCKFDENTILIGFSLGGVVALKVLEKLTHPIVKLVTAGGFIDPEFLDHDRNFHNTFSWKFNTAKILANTGEVVVLQDENDTAVSIEQAQRLAQALKTKVVNVKAVEPHFCGVEEPIILQYAIPSIKVFTTRPDTLFGATFLVLAPEHDLVPQITSKEQKEAVEKYKKEVARKTELERQTDKEKTGVFTGAHAVNPANGENIPIWIAEYVLMGYGTGAIMAVPAHDERDFEFAEKFNLPVKQVVGELLPDDSNPHKDGFPLEPRKIIIALIKHPKEDKYLMLNWAHNGYRTFVIGGIESNEEPEDAARREIQEETGYKNIKSISRIGNIVVSKFHAGHKKENRIAFTQGMLVELEDLERNEVSEEETAKHSLEWVEASHVLDGNTGSETPALWERINSGELKFNPFSEEGVVFNSGFYDGLSSFQAREKIVNDLALKEAAKEKVNFKMRDWSVSRQRYWGAPIPIIYCKDCGPQLVPDKDLPVVLPEIKNFQPSGDGRSALARAEEWVKVLCPKCGKEGERETDTLDTYICSSWYMLRYFDPQNAEKIFDSSIANKWMPIDFYNGADHATAHMIYARFVTRFFHKKGLLKNPEPFKKFLFNGKVTASDGTMFSKSKGNGVDPLDIIENFGADALRTYLMFAAPLDLWVRWDEQGVPGAFRFLNRVWTLVYEFLKSEKHSGSNEKVLKITHKTIKKVTSDLEQQKYNTAISSLMEMVNNLNSEKSSNGIDGEEAWRFAVESLVQLVAPFAPHMADELWQVLGYSDSVQKDHWPIWDEVFVRDDTAQIIIQINGKTRAKIEMPINSTEEEVKIAVMAEDKIKTALGGNEAKKVIYVEGRLINLVI